MTYTATLMNITEATSDTDENVCLWLILFAHSGHKEMAVTFPIFSRFFFLLYI